MKIYRLGEQFAVWAGAFSCRMVPQVKAQRCCPRSVQLSSGFGCHRGFPYAFRSTVRRQQSCELVRPPRWQFRTARGYKIRGFRSRLAHMETTAERDSLRYTKIPLTNRSGVIPALGFGTLIPDPHRHQKGDYSRARSRISSIRFLRTIPK
jgi:hypothetical protein